LTRGLMVIPWKKIHPRLMMLQNIWITVHITVISIYFNT
jgi:hypothetical protein